MAPRSATTGTASSAATRTATATPAVLAGRSSTASHSTCTEAMPTAYFRAVRPTGPGVREARSHWATIARRITR